MEGRPEVDIKLRRANTIYVIDIAGEMDLYNAFKLKDIVTVMIGRRVRHRVEFARGEIDAFVGGLRRQDDGDQQFERRAVDELAARLRRGRAQPAEDLDTFGRVHAGGE